MSSPKVLLFDDRRINTKELIKSFPKSNVIDVDYEPRRNKSDRKRKPKYRSK